MKAKEIYQKEQKKIKADKEKAAADALAAA